MKKILSVILVCLIMMLLVACEDSVLAKKSQFETTYETGNTREHTPSDISMDEIHILTEERSDKSMDNKMNVKIGDYLFTATLEDNQAVKELIKIIEKEPLVLQLDDYSGFEKVGSLGKSLTRNDKQITTHNGDIVLYNGNSIVIFYGSNSWSYTRLGKIDDLTNWKKALGNGSVTVTLSLE